MTETKSSKSPFGTAFTVIFWLIALGLLGSYFTQQQDHQYNPNREASSNLYSNQTELVLTRNRHHHYVFDGHINGVKTTFLLDTGATQVVIPYHLAKPMNLTTFGSSIAMTANGSIEVYNTRIDELDLAGIILRDVNASLNPAMRDNEVLLGMSALKSLELIHRDGNLTLRQYH